MNSTAHKIIAAGFALLVGPILVLGALEGQILAGFIVGLVMLINAVAQYGTGMELEAVEADARRLYKGKLY